MSRYPHRALAERNKVVQMKNSMENKILRQKLDSFQREKVYIDRELRRISLAKESLTESLDRYTMPPRFMHKRLSLPCLVDGKRSDSNAGPIGGLRRHTVDTVEDLHQTVTECKQPLKPLGWIQNPAPSPRKAPTTASTKTSLRGGHKNRPSSPLQITSMETPDDILEIRVTSPITASLIQLGQVDNNRFSNEKPALYSRQTSTIDTPLRLPKLSASPARKISTGQANPRDGMLATNLKSKFRQIGSVVMATAILRVAHEKRKATTGQR